MVERPLKTIEKNFGKRRIITTVDKETYDNFEKDTSKAIAISLDRAKEIARDMFKNMKKDPKKEYTLNFQYGDRWRASKTFYENGKVIFPDEDIEHTNVNTDLYDYVYGIQIIERTPEKI